MENLQYALDMIDIQNWIEQYVETKMHGDELRVEECPMCGNDKWKLYINVEKKTWFCQRCTWGKYMRDFTHLMAGISGRHVNDIKIELAKYVVPTPETDELMKQLGLVVEEPKEQDLLFEPIDLPGQLGLSGVTGGKAKKYLLGRGLTEDDLEAYGVRLATKLRNISGPWATFPVRYYSIPVGYQGRKFLNSNEPKYLSSDQIHRWLWPMTTEVIEHTEELKEVVLVEGIFDAISYRKLGINALCTFGKNLTQHQIKLLQVHGVTTVYLSYDADAHKDIQKIADRQGHIFHIKIIELTKLPENPKADPADVMEGRAPKDWLLEAYENALSTRDPEYWNWKLRKEMGL